jgi:hypothetical protein
VTHLLPPSCRNQEKEPRAVAQHRIRPPRRVIAGLLAALAAPAAEAQTPSQPISTIDPAGTFAFILENDTFSGKDRYYTNGFLFAWQSPSRDTPDWVTSLTRGPRLLFPEGGAPRWGLAFGQKMFTPEDTHLRNPPLDDRPYAGWLYGALSLMSATPREFGALELQLGIIGPGALGEQVQNNTHDLLNIERALGWNTQLKDEPGVNLIATRQWRFNAPSGVWDGVSVGVVPTVAASLGNVHTYGAVGGIVRIGTALDSDFGPPRVRPAAAGSVFYEAAPRWSWYAFAGLEGRAVLHDITLDGNTWRESRSVERQVLVGDASLGLAVFTPWGRVTATYTVRTEEFERQPEIAQFGSISVAFRF